MRFNPRPPFRAGATSIRAACNSTHAVSILARPFERALLDAFAYDEILAKFQSSPALSSGRYLNGAHGHERFEKFQSSPALSSGRYAAFIEKEQRIASFNPRPPFRAGATC